MKKHQLRMTLRFQPLVTRKGVILLFSTIEKLLAALQEKKDVAFREDEEETEWWWAHINDKEGYIPHNLLGLYPRIRPRQRGFVNNKTMSSSRGSSQPRY